MKRSLSLVVLMMILVAVPLATAQEDSNTIEFEILDNEIPLIRHGERGEWDEKHTGPAAIIHQDGLFHMFRNGYSTWPSPSSLGYLTSEDGFNWTEVSEAPVISHEEFPFDGIDLVLVQGGVILEDGTWALYLTPFPTIMEAGPVGVAIATADNPLGPWTIQENLILEPGPAGAWDSGFMVSPHVMKVADGYRMYYHANQLSGGASIGMATSPDGFTWTKYDNPNTTEAPYTESDPVYSMTDAGVASIFDPSVVQTPDGFVMSYGFNYELNSPYVNGYELAVSEDGIEWEQITGDPFITRRDFRYARPWYHKLTYQNDTYYFYVEVDSRFGTDIFVATHEGS